MMNESLHAPLSAGLPYPLGAHHDGLGVNFAVFSANASGVDLCLFDANGRKERRRVALPECTNEVWHGYLPDAQPGLLYGFRVHGPYDPLRGHRFNPYKFLLDPYARQLHGSVHWGDALFGYRVGHGRGDLSMDRRDSAPLMPKCVVTAQQPYPWEDSQPPRTPWADTLLYEAHVRGASMMREDLPPSVRGTAAALGDPRFVEHLHRLGVTAIELLPVHAFLQSRTLEERGLRNYWGYDTLAYFAPEPAYAPNGPNDLRQAIRRLHAAGIEVVLDVVYNHTCEGNEWGPTLSWRGIDNASYYRLIPGDERHYIDETGCGNTVNLSHPAVLRMVLDSLREWAVSYRVDGFRFDLCTTLGREGTGFDQGAGFFDAILQDPVLSRRKLIAEPWDVGPGGYQLGQHPPGFAEWNGAFRDGVRRYWRNDPDQRPGMADALCGSRSLFDHRHRRPWSSINFVTAHDGFTLADLVSYAERHNEANGEDGRDGTPENFSANWGAEGPTDDEAITRVRDDVRRALLASLFFADGTPMLLAGDESGHTQSGNNNAYCQDNPLSWLDWRQADSPAGKAMARYVGRLAALRRAHPSLHAGRYLDLAQELLPGVSRASHFEPDGQPVSDEHWADGERRAWALRRACPVAGGVDITLLLLNPGDETVSFDLPPPAFAWTCELDSARPDRHAARAGGSRSGRMPWRCCAPGAVRRRRHDGGVGVGRGPAMSTASDSGDPASADALSALAALAGLKEHWIDARGTPRRVSRDSLRSLLGAMGLACRTAGELRDARAALDAGLACGASRLRTGRAGESLVLPGQQAGAGLLEAEDGRTPRQSLQLAADPRGAWLKAPRQPGYYWLYPPRGEPVRLAIAPARAGTQGGRLVEQGARM